MKYCFLDLETTGFEPSKDSIIECSFVIYQNDQEINRFDQVFQADKSELNDFVSNLTGITQEELNKEGWIFSEHAEEIQKLIGESVIIGHNIDFDINFLIGNGIDVSKNARIDTHELARILLPLETSYALEVLTKKYGFAHESAHRAMSDVEASKRLFEMLEEKIEELPKVFLNEIEDFLKNKTNWDAKNLFLKAEGSKIEPSKNAKISIEKEINLNLEIPDKSQLNINFLKNSTETLSQIAQKKSKEQKVVLVTSRIDFYEDLEKFPTPEVLLDPIKLELFIENREKLNNAETTFYLKLKQRQHKGYRGLFFFDLFFKERDLWKEIYMDRDAEIFSEICIEKSKSNLLVASPKAYFDFIDDPIFKNRFVVFDEGEQIAKECLFSEAKTFSLHPFLNHFDTKIATAAQFTVSNICRDFIEKKLGREIGVFPQKMLLEAHDDIRKFIDELSEIVDHKEWDFWKDTLKDAPERSVRWLIYYPEQGNLSFGCWHPDTWRDLKQKINEKNKLCTYRTSGENKDLFFKMFLGITPLDELEIPNKKTTPRLITPENLISVKSPEFNDFSAQKVVELLGKTSGNLAINFSSLDSLRKVYDALTKNIDKKDIFLVGEKVNGGAGKILELMENNREKRIVFCFQRLNHPALPSFEFENLILQKFIFAPPEPLLDKIKDLMSQNGQSFWDVWIMTHMKNEIARRVEVFQTIKNVYCLDSRENARWGKEVLKSVFK